jgi:hypothetical protein
MFYKLYNNLNPTDFAGKFHTFGTRVIYDEGHYIIMPVKMAHACAAILVSSN